LTVSLEVDGLPFVADAATAERAMTAMLAMKKIQIGELDRPGE
jgi:predicted 3-demethylubiquinone-9 3-methyltransferase (glyoxalase superfamily)